MSESKKDRSIAPVKGTRRSRAKQERDRNTTPPAAKTTAARKPKKGERVMKAQLAAKPAEDPQAIVVAPAAALDDSPPPADPWWTPERELTFKHVLMGIPQHQISTELGRDRHTIARWCEDERFVERLIKENDSRFTSMRQRRAMGTVRLTEKTEQLANKLLDKAVTLAEAGKDDLGTRLAARDWLQEFREQSRREDEIYGINNQRVGVDVNVHGSIKHDHKHKGVMLNLSFKEFVHGAMKKLGVDPQNEEVDAQRADEALVAVTEKALLEGSFLDELVEREKKDQLELAAASQR